MCVGQEGSEAGQELCSRRVSVFESFVSLQVFATGQGERVWMYLVIAETFLLGHLCRPAFGGKGSVKLNTLDRMLQVPVLPWYD